MKQITIEKPDAIRIEPCAQDGFVEVVIISNISPLPVIREDEQESTEYESEIYRLTYPVTENLLGYAEKHFDVFVELAKAEEIAGKPTQNAEKLAALMIENKSLRAMTDKNVADIDYIAMMTDVEFPESEEMEVDENEQ